ncbi:MAG: cupin domain-containing protein [Candidatus Sulfotelmatobacter sp.]
MSRPQKLFLFVLVCASSVIVARAQPQTTPSPEVKKLAVMVGKFTIEDELKAGFMGPNSPAMKFSGTDDCRWTADGFAVICETVLYRPGKKYSETSFVYYDPTAKTYRYHAVDSSGGTEDKTGTVSGDVWTWLGDSVFGGKVYHTRYTMKVVSADSYDYTDESGESEDSMKVFVSGKETRVAASEPEKSQATQAGATPLLLEKNEGETRLWRPEPGEADIRGFILKVTPKANGSEHLVLGTEDMPPGAAIPTHKHLEQDEIVLIEKGTIHAHVGDQEHDLHAGGMVFIPRRTWVSLNNTGTEPASITFLFSAPGFENHLRCESVPAGEKPTTISQAEENVCDHLGHVVYKDRGEEDPDK